MARATVLVLMPRKPASSRMLGSATHTEDILQEAFVRWLQAGEEKVQSPRVYLSTIGVRLCIKQAE